MKTLTKSLLVALLASATAFLFVGCKSSDPHHHATTGAKPYPLNKCIVTDEDFHGDTYTFVHEGQEVKLCCKDCLGDFQQEPAKYLKKIEEAKMK